MTDKKTPEAAEPMAHVACFNGCAERCGLVFKVFPPSEYLSPVLTGYFDWLKTRDAEEKQAVLRRVSLQKRPRNSRKPKLPILYSSRLLVPL